MKQGNLDYKRNCPTCNNEIVYSTKGAYVFSLKKSGSCKKCSAIKQFKDLDKKIKEGKAVNGFQGKNHSIGIKDNMSNKIRELYQNGKLDTSGINNGMFGKTGEKSPQYGITYKDRLERKYGEEEADRRNIIRKKKISLKSSGENNPMYGKPSPLKSGNGWAGWYKGWYFRSLRELSFMINYIERFNIKWENGENINFRINYYLEGIRRNYYPDFILNSKYMIECKPKSLWKSKLVSLKTQEAILFCKKRGLIYKMIDPILLTIEKLQELYNNKVIIFNRASEIKFNNYVTNMC